MTETKSASEMVSEFHRKFGCPIARRPTLIAKDRADLRLELIREEFTELKEAVSSGNLIGIADGLADLEYVIHGMALEYGIPLDLVTDEVHRSNMTKTWPDGTVKRREDGKIIKPPTYSKANIKSVLDGTLSCGTETSC